MLPQLRTARHKAQHPVAAPAATATLWQSSSGSGARAYSLSQHTHPLTTGSAAQADVVAGGNPASYTGSSSEGMRAIAVHWMDGQLTELGLRIRKHCTGTTLSNPHARITRLPLGRAMLGPRPALPATSSSAASARRAAGRLQWQGPLCPCPLHLLVHGLSRAICSATSASTSMVNKAGKVRVRGRSGEGALPRGFFTLVHSRPPCPSYPSSSDGPTPALPAPGRGPRPNATVPLPARPSGRRPRLARPRATPVSRPPSRSHHHHPASRPAARQALTPPPLHPTIRRCACRRSRP